MWRAPCGTPNASSIEFGVTVKKMCRKRQACTTRFLSVCIMGMYIYLSIGSKLFFLSNTTTKSHNQKFGQYFQETKGVGDTFRSFRVIIIAGRFSCEEQNSVDRQIRKPIPQTSVVFDIPHCNSTSACNDRTFGRSSRTSCREGRHRWI